jgi:hypothetical protein
MRDRKRSKNGNGGHTALPALCSEGESPALLMERDPELYGRIVDFLGQGLSPAGVAALARVKVGTVRKIRALIGEAAILAGIRAVGRNLVEASQLMSERLVNEAGEIPINMLPSALGTIADRANLFAGGATARIEHRSVPTPEDLKQMFDSLPQADVTTIEETAPEEKKPVSAPSHTPPHTLAFPPHETLSEPP